MSESSLLTSTPPTLLSNRVTTVPSHARVVIVGGGIIGCSIAYHLAHMGCRDVVLLERDRLTSGTTWHAAGLMVTFGSTSSTSTELRKYTRDLYNRLEAETGQATGFKPVGFIEVAADRDRLEEYRRVSAFNRLCGVDVHELSAKEVGDLFPIAKTDDILAGFYVKEDGRVNPVDVTMALAKGARQQGATLLEEVPCTGILKSNGHVTGVRTPLGDIHCEIVVNAAGMWARQLGELAGVTIPLQAAEHYYLITDKVPGISANWPVLEDPGRYGYYREEVGGLMVGLFEPKSAPWKVEGIPQNFSFGEITPDWDRMGPFVERALGRIPMLENLGIRKFFCGPESFTPDLRPVVGEAPELRGYYVCAGLNSIGILTGGGMGRLMAQWILSGHPDMDITGMNIDRLQPYQVTPQYRRERIVESLGLVYKCHYPFKTMETARDAKRSPLHAELHKAGAFLRDVSGWECADWYAPTPAQAVAGPLSFGRPDWFPYWRAEHEACRNASIVMDMSFMAKFLVQGRDAGRYLQWLCAGDVDGPVGRITYTQCLDAKGFLQADLTVNKLADDKFLVVASDTAHRHVHHWIERHIPSDFHCFVTDVTSAYAQLNVQGPTSRALLQSLTATDLGNEALPFRGVKEIAIGFAKLHVARITYLGELGYELLIPTEQAAHVYSKIMAVGGQFGLRLAGLKALASLRMEKGYRDYGHDIDNTDTVLEAGLGFAVDWNKPSFLGREAALAQKAAGPLKKRLVQIQVLDPEPLMFHAEVLWRGGQRAGYVRAASYGHTLGGAVGLAMIEADVPIDQAWLDAAPWQVEISDRKYPAKLSLRPLYDPAGARIKA